jgi:hypothetical protein
MSARAVDPVADALMHPVPAPALAQPGDGGPERGDGRFARPPFPRDCPVKPLGIAADISGTQKCYYLDVTGQINGLEAGNRHGKNSLIFLFGGKSDWLELHYPQWSKPVTEYDRSTKTHTVIKPSEIIGFDQAEASRALIEACVALGPFTPAGKLRGRGAHRSAKGNLIVHFGDRLLMPRERINGTSRAPEWVDPGIYGGHVYPAAEATLRPHHEPCGEDIGEQLLAFLNSWTFKRPLLDPMFVLGQIGASYLGGWLDWRPVVWVTGDAGTGKSTLDGKPSRSEGLIGHLLGKGVLNSADPTEASIRRTLKNATIPVIFDEAEASGNNERVQSLVKMARIAAGGGSSHRVAADLSTEEFALQSAFWFSSINPVPLAPQDRSRIVMIELRPLRAGLLQPDYSKTWGRFRIPAEAVGERLLRRMIDAAPGLDAIIDAFRATLVTGGHGARSAKLFSTLLGCAWAILNDDPPSDEMLDHWGVLCAPDNLAEISGAISNQAACVDRIMTSPVQAKGGDEREALGSWIGRAVSAPLLAVSEDKSGARLEQIGLKLVNPRRLPAVRDASGKLVRQARWGAVSYMAGEPCYLAVAGQHQALAALFSGTSWTGGGWSTTLARIEMASGAQSIKAIEGVKVKFGHSSLTAVLVPLSFVLDESDLPAASRVEAVAEWIAAAMLDEGGVS